MSYDLKVEIEFIKNVCGGILVFFVAFLITQALGLLLSREVRGMYKDFFIAIRKRIAIFILRKFYKDKRYE